MLEELKNKFSISVQESSDIEKLIISDLTKFSTPSDQPKAIILGSQPGAGKSELEKLAFIDLGRNAIICNVDNLKKFHPHSQEIARNYPEYYTDLTNEYAHKWNLALRNYCLKNKINFILETTFSDGNSINIILDKIKKNHFQTELYILSVAKEISLCGISIRYEDNIKNLGIARKVGYQAHNDRYDKIPEAIKTVEEKRLYDYFNLYGRSINSNSEETNGVYLITRTKNSIYDAFIEERDKGLTLKAVNYIRETIDQVRKLMILRNASFKEKIDFNNILKTNFRLGISNKSKSKKI